MSATDIKEVVKEKYGQAALRVTAGGTSWCGGSAATSCDDPIASHLVRRRSSRAPKARFRFPGL
jgi:hypothetical protein